jgi:hypothetical protein
VLHCDFHAAQGVGQYKLKMDIRASGKPLREVHRRSDRMSGKARKPRTVSLL